MSLGKLLVIDDEPDIGELFGRVGRTLGFETVVVERPNDFKAQLPSFCPDVILLDLFMPETDGFELLHYLGVQGCRAHVIITSGKDLHFLSAARRMALAYGLASVDTLCKPVPIEELAEALGRAALRQSSPSAQEESREASRLSR